MSTFFKDTDLTRQEADRLVSETLKNCDDGELFFESSKQLTLNPLSLATNDQKPQPAPNSKTLIFFP